MTTRPSAVRQIALIVLTVAIAGAPRSGHGADTAQWDQQRMTSLAAQLLEGIKGIRSELRSVSRGIGSMKAWTYYRLLDDLRLIESEAEHLYAALAAGETRDETRPAFVRIAMLRRSCAEEMQKQFLGSPVLDRVSRARAIVQEMNPYYGFDRDDDDHARVLEREAH